MRTMARRRGRNKLLAARLGKLFGDGAGGWIRMQGAYDAWHAEREVDVSGIPTIRAA